MPIIYLLVSITVVKNHQKSSDSHKFGVLPMHSLSFQVGGWNFAYGLDSRCVGFRPCEAGLCGLRGQKCNHSLGMISFLMIYKLHTMCRYVANEKVQSRSANCKCFHLCNSIKIGNAFFSVWVIFLNQHTQLCAELTSSATHHHAANYITGGKARLSQST